MESFAPREFCDRPGLGCTSADLREGFEVSSNQVDVESGPEGCETLIVHVDAAAEESAFGAVQNYSGIGEFLAFGGRHNA